MTTLVASSGVHVRLALALVALLTSACLEPPGTSSEEHALAAFATDRSGNGHHAELRSTIAVTGDGSATALEFRGAAIAIVPETIKLSTSWEIEARFKWPLANANTTTWHTLTRGTGCGDHQIIIHTDQVSLGTYDNCTGGGWKDSGYDLTGLTAGWHTVKAVGTAAGATEFHVDGALVGTVPWRSTSNVYAIGAYQSSPATQPFGTIDDVRITVNGALAAAYDFEPAACGDGLADPGEVCDDGNTADGDCCNAACAGPGGGAGACPAMWTALVNVSAAGGNLTKYAGGTAWNAGATSIGAIASGHGHVEFGTADTGTGKMLGLSNGNTDANYPDIDFAIYLKSTGAVEIYEKGTFRAAFGTWTTADRFRVAVEGGIVRYLKNGAPFYTSPNVPTYPLSVDTSLYESGATLTNVTIALAAGVCGDGIADQGEACDDGNTAGGDCCAADCSGWGGGDGACPAVWTTRVGTAASGSTLRKTDAAASWNAGAVTTQAIASGRGFVEFSGVLGGKASMLGLSNGNTDQNYPDLDFAVYLRSNGGLEVYEKGTLRGAFGTWGLADRFRVEATGDVVRYLKNGAPFYTSGNVPSYPLLVDTSIYDNGGGFLAVNVDPASGTCGDGLVDAGEACDGGTCCNTSCAPANDAGACGSGGTCDAGRCVQDPATWTDYRVTTSLLSTDDDQIGLAVRFRDAANHYRFVWSAQGNYRRIERVSGGAVTVLATLTGAYAGSRNYRIEMVANGSTIQALVDGAVILTATDSTHAAGTVALYSDGNAGTSFDNVEVRALDGTGLLAEGFADGDFAGWALIDKGTSEAPSRWSVTGGRLVQTANIYTGGTFAAWGAPEEDLVAASFTAPAAAASKQLVPLSWTVTNAGNGAAEGRWYPGYWDQYYAWGDDVYLSADETCCAGDTYVGQVRRINAPVAPGAAYTVNTTMQFPNVADGAYRLVLALDAIDDVHERNETNNLTTPAITIANADLRVASSTTPPAAASGQVVPLAWTITNAGGGTATGRWYSGYWDQYYAWTDQIFVSVDAARDAADVYVGEVRRINTPLAAGASYSVSTTKQMPNIADGNYHALIVTDASNDLRESDDTNNVAATPLVLANADLVVTAVTAPLQVASGELMPASWTVTNQGAGTAHGRWYDGYWDKYYAWNDNVYLSADAACCTGDTYVGQVRRINTPLVPGASYSASPTLQLPAIADGAYQLLVVADGAGDIREANDANNVWSQAISIGNPDLQYAGTAAPAQGASGEVVALSWSVQNAGNGVAQGRWYDGYWDKYYAWNDNVYLSTDALYAAGDVYVGQVRRINLPVQPGATYAAAASMVIPNVADGAWNMLFVTDATADLRESSETNNVSARPFTVGNADLVVTAATAPAQAAAGEIAALSWTVHNNGTGKATGRWYDGYWEKYRAWNDNVYLSADGVCCTGDTYVGQVRRINAPVAAGASYTVEVNMQLPSIADGNYQLLIKADATGDLNEAVETNNVWAQPMVIGNPDLGVAAIAAAAQVASGELAQLSWTITNGGNGVAQGKWYPGYWDKYYAWNDNVYLSADAACCTGDTYVGQVRRINASLAAGDSYSVTTTKQVPAIVEGSYNLLVFTDATADVRESDEADNVGARPIVVANPDLGVAAFEAPASAASGEAIALSWSVANSGGGKAEGRWYDGYWDKYYAWNDNVYVSTDGALDAADAYVGQVRRINAPLAAGAAYNVTTSKKLPSIANGNYQILAVADATADVNESNEGNNTAARPLVIANADLTIAASSITAPASVAAGQITDLAWTVDNVGGGRAEGRWYDGYWDKYHAWIDKVYLSTDAAYSAGDVLVGEVRRINTPLAAGASYAVATAKQFPSIAEGEYHLIVVTDAAGDLYEASETNNAAARPLTIGNPDLTVAAVTSPASGASGERVQLSWTVSNLGTGQAHGKWYPGYWDRYYAWADRAYVSTDAVRDAADSMIGEVRRINTPLAAAASYTASASWQLPALPNGAYQLLVVTDAVGDLTESNETNNTFATPLAVGNPDLVVASSAAPAAGASGELVALSWTVDNAGTGKAEGRWYDGYWDKYYAWNDNVYVSTDAVRGTGDAYVGQVRRINQPVAAGASYTAAPNMQLPALADGAYHLIVAADATGDLNEASETNNDLARPLNVANSDLIVSAVEAPATGVAGADVALSWTVANPGAGRAHGKWYDGYWEKYYAWEDKLYLSSDAVHSAADPYIGALRRINTPLVAGGSYTASLTAQLPAVAAGAYHVIAIADGNAAIRETDDTNNAGASAATISVENTDLAAGDLAVNTGGTVGIGQILPVSWTVTNPSTATARGSLGDGGNAWDDRVYLSADATYDAADVQLGSVRRSTTLAAGASYTAGGTFVIPTVPTGSYYVILRADATARVAESTEANNVVATAATVAIRAPVATEPAAFLPVAAGTAKTMRSPTFSPDGALLAAAEGNRVALWSTDTGALRGTVDVHTGAVNSVGFAPLGDQVVTASLDGTVKRSDTATRTSVGSWTQTVSGSNPAAFSPDGARVITGTGNNATVRSAVTGDVVAVLTGHTGNVSSVSLSPDGARAATGAADGRVIVWDVATATRLATIASGSVAAVEFSPDGTEVMAGLGSGWLRFYRAADGVEIASIYQGRTIVDAAYSPRGTHVASCDNEWTWHYGRCYLFERTGLLVATFNVPNNERGHERWTGIAFSADSTTLATSFKNDFSSDPNVGGIYLWPSGLPATAITASVAVAMTTPHSFTVHPHGRYQFDFDLAADHAGVVIHVSGVPTADVTYANSGGTAVAVELFGARGRTPSPSVHDDTVALASNAVAGDILVERGAGGAYSVLVRAPTLTGGAIAATIRADYDDFHLARAETNAAGNAGEVTIRIRGTGISRTEATARLISPSAVVLDAVRVVDHGDTRLFATFDLQEAVPGAYDVEVERLDGSLLTLADAVTVTPGAGPALQYTVEGPPAIRRGRAYTFAVTWENTGDSDAVSPFVAVTAPDLNAFFSPGGTYKMNSRMWLAGVDGWPGHVIPAGTRGRAVFQASFVGTYRIDLKIVDVDATPFDWAAIEARAAPSDPVAWNEAALKIGSTQDEVFGKLRRIGAFAWSGSDFNELLRTALWLAMNGALDEDFFLPRLPTSSTAPPPPETCGRLRDAAVADDEIAPVAGELADTFCQEVAP